MTREEVIEIIEKIKDYYTEDSYGDEYHGLSDEENEVLDMVIKALEHESCEMQ